MQVLLNPFVAIPIMMVIGIVVGAGVALAVHWVLGPDAFR